MKLEVEMFIRTTGDAYEPSKIGKIKEVDITSFKEVCYRIDSCGKHILIPESFIKKASFNIIDLIEVGDYVNGRRVTSVWKDELVLYAYAGSQTTYTIKNEDIEEILTHEQYNSNKYVIGDDNNE